MHEDIGAVYQGTKPHSIRNPPGTVVGPVARVGFFLTGNLWRHRFKEERVRMLFGEASISAGTCPPVVHAVQRRHWTARACCHRAGRRVPACPGRQPGSFRSPPRRHGHRHGILVTTGREITAGSRYPDRHPQGEPLISEMARKYAPEDRKGCFCLLPTCFIKRA